MPDFETSCSAESLCNAWTSAAKRCLEPSQPEGEVDTGFDLEMSL